MFAVCRALGRLVWAAPFSPFHPQFAEHFDAADAERLDRASHLAAFVALILFISLELL